MSLKIPTKRGSKKPYDFAGEYHWSEITDWTIRNYDTIWNIPMRELGREVQTLEGIKVPIVKRALDPINKIPEQKYYLVKFDFEYLTERFFQEYVASLGWKDPDIERFSEISMEWLKERSNYFLKQQLLEEATQFAKKDRLKRSVEWWLEWCLENLTGSDSELSNER